MLGRASLQTALLRLRKVQTRDVVEKVEQRLADHFLDGIAEHFRHPPVDEGGRGGRIDQPDTLECAFDDAPVARFTRSQCLVRALCGADISVYPDDSYHVSERVLER